jgi:hypothetical protein
LVAAEGRAVFIGGFVTPQPSAAPAIRRYFCRISLALASQEVICVTWDIFPLTNFPCAFIIYAISDKAICPWHAAGGG